MKRPVKKWEENDVVTGWRKYYVYLKRAGVTSAIKRRIRRRERHIARHRLDRGEE